MHVLRISHTGSHVETSFVGHVLADQTVVGQALPPGNLVAQPLRPVSDKRPFDFTLSPQDAEDIRWYLEDYRIYPVADLPLALSVHSFVRTHSRRPCFQIRLRSPRASPASSSLSAARTQGTTFPSAPLPATCCAA